jgi:hypothetical protein
VDKFVCLRKLCFVPLPPRLSCHMVHVALLISSAMFELCFVFRSSFCVYAKLLCFSFFFCACFLLTSGMGSSHSSLSSHTHLEKETVQTDLVFALPANQVESRLMCRALFFVWLISKA